jgi:hypothetical protein
LGGEGYDLVCGSDLSKTKGGVMLMSEIGIFSYTLSNADVSERLKYMNNEIRSKEKFLFFDNRVTPQYVSSDNKITAKQINNLRESKLR